MTRNARLLAIATTGALALVGLGAATAAQADSQILSGTVTLLGQGSGQAPGSAITSGSQSDNPMFYGITISAGCPSGYQGRSDAGIFQSGTRLGSISTARTQSTPSSYGKTGLDGQPVAMSDADTGGTTNVYVANKALSGLTSGTLQSGAFELRYYCSASSASADYSNDKYFVLGLVANADGTWSYPVADHSVQTTTSLSGKANADGTVTLTATIKPASGSATPTGSVVFSEGSNNSAAVPVGSDGTASFTTTKLSNGSHSFTASYTSSDTTRFKSSSSSAFSTSVGGYAYDITVTIAQGAGGGSLRLSGYTRSTVDLGTAKLDGTLLKAQGNLPGGLKVIDDRQVGAAAWSLTGQDTDFVTSDSSKSFDGGYLGWTPQVAGGDNNAPAQGQAGPQVQPISVDPNGGLKSQARVLAYGQVTSANAGTTTTTNVGAQLNLAVPQQTAAGQYNSVLTLTLS